MPEERRQLIAALFADITGYTALMQDDEQKALSYLTIFKRTLENHTKAFGGEIIQFYGDGCLVTFQNSKDAVECARDLQLEFTKTHCVPVRMGIHLGDAVFRDDNVFGDSVNIASRIESMGVPGSVLFSSSIYEQVKNQEGIQASSLGTFDFKNVEIPIEVYALSLPGLKVPDRKTLEGKFKPRTLGRPRTKILMAIGLVLILVFVYSQLPKDKEIESATEIKTLGILQFDIPDGDKTLDYLAAGIPENLINRMSSHDDLKVLSRNSTFAVSESRNDLTKLRELLQADIILTGSLTTVQDYLVLSCQLIDLVTGNQIWGQKLRHPSGDIFALEDSLVNALITPLEISMRSTDGRRVPHPEAYTHYLKGRMLTYGSTPEESEKALDHFRKAVDIDPQFALAYAGIAKVKFVQAMFGNTSHKELVREAFAATQQAKNLDPDLLEAHLAEANIHFYIEQDWAGAETAFEEASKIDPRNVDLNIEFAYFKNMMGQFEDARDMADLALQLDPISTASLHMAAWTRLFTAEYSEAANLLTTALELNPGWTWGWLKLGIANALDGHCDVAIGATDKTNELTNNWGSELVQSYVGAVYAKCGATDKAQAAYDRMMAHADTTNPSIPAAYVVISAALHDQEQVVYWGERTFSEKSVYCFALHAIPKLRLFDPAVFDDPRFKKVQKDLNFPN